MSTNMQPAPIRNITTIGASVYSHNGEFMPVYTDLLLTGRGIDFRFIRSYRSSLCEKIGEMGRGWSGSIAKKLVHQGDDIVYFDGTGDSFKFAKKKDGNYTSPTGFYGILSVEREKFIISNRFGLTLQFETPENGGRITRSQDRNHNSINLSYTPNSINILDSLDRNIEVSINKGLLQELNDHAGRTWKYSYDQNDCLNEVTQPETAGFPEGTSIKYSYDTSHRLVSITDAKGQQYLVNKYDRAGRVVEQVQGGGVFKMDYHTLDNDENGFPIYRTTCLRKNGSRLVLEHNDLGNVLTKTLFVNEVSLSPEYISGEGDKTVPLITNSTYNKNSELTSRTFPAGNQIEWLYSEDAKNPLNQGNLLQLTEISYAEVVSDRKRIVTQYEVEPRFQFTIKRIDPRGNQTSFAYDEQGNLLKETHPEVTIQPVNDRTPRPITLNWIQTDEYKYNAKGQLLERKHLDGSITEYYYYPANDPIGKRGLDSVTKDIDTLCGYLGRVVRDANDRAVKNEYAYDKFGNVTTVWDGKSNPAHLQYNAMGKVENVTSRGPFKNRIDYKYDANYNEVESIQLFDRFEFDEKNKKPIVNSSTLREIKEYNAMNNVIQRKIAGENKLITEHFIRDANENIVRQVQPSGNTTEYIYDERGLLVEKKSGTGTREAFSERFTYTLNSAVSTYTDGNGNLTRHHYDGFQRYKGFTNALGINKTQWFDDANNIVRVEINERENGDGRPLMATNYNFDQWNRVYRVDQVWIDASKGQELGQSKWDSEAGIVSTVVEFTENGLPGKIWTESDNVMSLEYDGVGRIIKIKDLTGEEFSFTYDENNNPTLMNYIGPKVEGRRCERNIRNSYDAMDRLVLQQKNEEAPEKFEYNALGNVINYVGKSGTEFHYIDDVLGRRVGHAYTITDAQNTDTLNTIVRRFEYDDNYRLTAYTDAMGNRTAYFYDTHDRQTRIVYPNGNVANVAYDANGNIIGEVDENYNIINNRYDTSNRLVERQSLIKNAGQETIEQFEYDGLNRLIAAITPDMTILRTYDSLSRLLTEQQGDHLVGSAYDSTGNLTRLAYPGGEEVLKAYDIRNRVTSVNNKAGETIAGFMYRANDQIATLILGNGIKTDFSYNQQEHLEAIEYRRTDNQDLVDGFRYEYDNTGKMSHEIQLSEGPTYGERYYYDDANRPTKAQYGVQDVFDPKSDFELETSYEHFSEGSWQRRVDVNGHGELIEDQRGTINELNNYQAFGSLGFAYDANGNCIRKGKSNPGYCIYTYDQDNRLTRSECYDALGDKIQTIEYFYDAFGRQVRKVVTDMGGKVTQYTYVWAGTLLLEEYENGVLVQTYLYGVGSLPVQLSVNRGERSDFYYTHNGKGLASGLLHKRDPYAFAEKYGYEITGASYMKEINGVKVALPSRHSTNSSLANSILSGTYLKDWANGSHSGIGGIHANPEIATVLNSVGNGHGGVSGVLTKQTNDYLNMIGRGSQGGMPTLDRVNIGGASNEKIHTISNSGFGVDKRGTNNAAGPPTGVKLGFRAPHHSLYGADTVTEANLKKVPMTGVLNEYKDLQKNAEKKADDSVKPFSDKFKDAWNTAINALKGEKKDGGTKYVNPDFNGGGVNELLSPLQIEAKLKQTKRPINPNGGIGVTGISQSEGPAINKRDLISLYDGELSVIGDFGGRTVLIGGGYTTTVRGWEPVTPEVDPNSREGLNPVAQQWP